MCVCACVYMYVDVYMYIRRYPPRDNMYMSTRRLLLIPSDTSSPLSPPDGSIHAHKEALGEGGDTCDTAHPSIRRV